MYSLNNLWEISHKVFETFKQDFIAPLGIRYFRPQLKFFLQGLYEMCLIVIVNGQFDCSQKSLRSINAIYVT